MANTDPMQLHAGQELVSPHDPTLRISWRRLKGILFAGYRILLDPKAYSVDVAVATGRVILNRQVLPYDTWLEGSRLVGSMGFSFLLHAPTRSSGSQLGIYIKWESQESGPSAVPTQSTDSSSIGSGSRVGQLAMRMIPDVPLERPIGSFSCKLCRYHRPPTSLVDTLLSDIGRYIGTGSFALRNRLLEEETNLEADQDEAEYKPLLDAVIAGEDQELTWSRRPSSHSYCGLNEGLGVWYFEEAKNQTGNCPDMRPRESPVGERTCSTCVHGGSTPDDLIAAIQECLASVGAQASMLIEQFDRELASRAEYEVTTAFRNVGRLPTEPVLLPMCSKFSSRGKFVVGPCVNSGDRCNGWEDGGDAERYTEAQAAALAAWAAVVQEREAMSSRQAAAARAAATNIWLEPAYTIGEGLDSTSYDQSRVRFLTAALPAVGIPAGKASMMVTLADRALRDERRMPYFPPPSTR